MRVVEVDVSPAAYNDWHIGGAVLWNVYSDLKTGYHSLWSTAELQRLLERLGSARTPPSCSTGTRPPSASG